MNNSNSTAIVALLAVLVIALTLLSTVAVEGRRAETARADLYLAQIEEACRVSNEMWYDLRKETPEVDAPFSMSCVVDGSYHLGIKIVRRAGNGYVGYYVNFGGKLVPYKKP